MQAYNGLSFIPTINFEAFDLKKNSEESPLLSTEQDSEVSSEVPKVHVVRSISCQASPIFSSNSLALHFPAPTQLESHAILNDDFTAKEPKRIPLIPKIVEQDREAEVADYKSYEDIISVLPSNISPLRYAIYKNDIGLVNYLAKKKKVDLNAPDPSGKTPLMKAISSHHPEMVRCLAKLGADVNKVDNNGYSPATLAILLKDHQSLRILYEHFADFNLEDKNGRLPLNQAIIQKNRSAIQFLLDVGVNIFKADSRGSTPLYTAVGADDPITIYLLHYHGADIRANYLKNGQHIDLLTCAYEFDCHQAAKALEDLGLNKEVSRERLERSFLAHIWSIGGESICLDQNGEKIVSLLEGMGSWYAFSQLIYYVESFFETEHGQELPSSVKENVLNILKTSYANFRNDSYLVAEEIQKGVPMILAGGTGDHALFFVLVNDNLYVCNKGEGQPFDRACLVYHLPCQLVTNELVQILNREHRDVDSIYKILKDLKLPIEKNKKFKQKSQTIGNCTWVGAKTTLHILLREYLGATEGKAVYKKFAEFTRRHSLINYLSDSKNVDQSLIQQIIRKENQRNNRDKVEEILSYYKLAFSKEKRCVIL